MLTCLIAHNVAAQSLETLVMPGDVVADHADIESECSSCHKPFSRSEQRALCLDCHIDVATDVGDRTGFHGKSSAARTAECAACHTDHEGRGADILGLNEASFDHRLTDFELIAGHLDAACADCHTPDDRHREAPSECIGCHADDDVHGESLGTDCASCHIESAWLETRFDHDITGYSLLGGHADAACLDCHETQAFEKPFESCYGCHAGDDVHAGRSGEQCDNCHNPVAWTEVSFAHSRDTDFVLLGRHTRLACEDCHVGDPFSVALEMECIGCHLEHDEHDGHNGSDCASCHGNDEWPVILFDHDRDTGFELKGSHPAVACADCHAEPIFEASPGTSCASCHLEDDIHDGKQGDQCADCHSEANWQDAPFFDHDLARFPLLGEHGNIECDACHQTRAFAGTATDCNSCHEDDDTHAGRFDENCQSCHNPVAWNLWLFDHNAESTFQLVDAHAGVACADCHRSSLASMTGAGQTCAACHRTDDIHAGDFGRDCGRCHNTQSFREVRSLQ